MTAANGSSVVGKSRCCSCRAQRARLMARSFAFHHITKIEHGAQIVVDRVASPTDHLPSKSDPEQILLQRFGSLGTIRIIFILVATPDGSSVDSVRADAFRFRASRDRSPVSILRATEGPRICARNGAPLGDTRHCDIHGRCRRVGRTRLSDVEPQSANLRIDTP